MCNEGAQTELPYVRQWNMDGVALCVTREHRRGCRMCEHVVRYVLSRDVHSVRILGSEPGPECLVSWFGAVTW